MTLKVLMILIMTSSQILQNYEGQPEKKETRFLWPRIVQHMRGSKSPMSYQEAAVGPDKEKWEIAMNTEMASLKENDIWDIIACKAKDSWVQMGIQNKNRSRWICAEIQSKTSCIRFHSEIWN